MSDPVRPPAEPPAKPARRGILSLIGPGMLVAATGVGAGDLATAGFAGSKLGPAILWAVVLGAFLKFVLTEGLARWQVATGETILEGALSRFGRIAQLVFLAYLLAWSVFVGAALMSACGATTRAIVPVMEPKTGKIVFGMVSSAAGVALVLLGGFKLFERVMAACVALMFVVVVVTAAMVTPDWGAVARGLVVPVVPGGEGLSWTIALIGGVGGTLTIICYGYWMREQGRDRTAADAMRITRIDVGVGYVMTGVFGIAMVIIASGIELASGGGTALIIELSDVLGDRVGPAFKWVFLIGAWGAVFSSLLGVWQAVPYVFADFRRVVGRDRDAPAVDTRGKAYRGYLLFIAIVPMAGLFVSFSAVQKYYAVFGALFIPLVAVTLLVLNRPTLVGDRYRNRAVTIGVLVGAVLLALAAGVVEVRESF